MTLGDWSWGTRTGGRLSRAEELRCELGVARAAVGAAFTRRLRTRAGHDQVPTRSLVLAETPPDSVFPRAALAAAQDVSSPGLLAHCIRAWLWADLLAQADDVPHDPELLYAACVLHDLGLTETYWCRRAECFAVEGAMAAHDLARENGYPAAESLAEAISLHLNVTVPLRHGAEAHLLHAGTTTDLLGLRLNRIPTPLQVQVLRRHPRESLDAGLLEPVRRQALARPRSRVAVLERRAGLTARATHAAVRFPA
jgi:hypothetical protein